MNSINNQIFIVSPLEQFYFYPMQFYTDFFLAFLLHSLFVYISYLSIIFYSGSIRDYNLLHKLDYKEGIKELSKWYLPLLLFFFYIHNTPIYGFLFCGIFFSSLIINGHININRILLHCISITNKFILFIRNIFINNLKIKSNVFMVIFIIIFFYLTFLNLRHVPIFFYTSHLTFTFFVSFSYFIGKL